MNRHYSGEDFAKAMSDDSLRGAIVREGMAKPDPDNHKAILFAETDCNAWIRIPTAFVDEVTLLSKVKCRDHEHPRVRIRFKEPVENAGAQLFADLARNSAIPSTPVLDEDADGLVPEEVFRQTGGGTVGDGRDPLDRCKCIGYEWHYRVVYVRIAPGVVIPVLRRTRGECSIYECSPR